jgi:hypothetical protein
VVRSHTHTHTHDFSSLFRRLKSKGAVSSTGEILNAVELTEEEESFIGTDLLIKLAGAGALK